MPMFIYLKTDAQSAWKSTEDQSGRASDWLSLSLPTVFDKNTFLCETTIPKINGPKSILHAGCR